MAKSRGRKFAEITSPTSGVFDLTSVPTITNAKLQNSAMTLAGSSVSLGGTGVADTDALSEGSSNLYFTNARVQSFLGGGTLAGNIVVPDNRSIYLGSDSDFRMVHNTTNTQLINATGALQITSNGGFAVTGATTFSSTINMSGALTINTGNNGVPTINLSHSNSGADNFRIMAGITGVGNGGFSIYDVDASASRFTIDSSGNVGIGEDTPTAPLHIDAAGMGDIYSGRIENTTTDTDHYNVIRWIQGASGSAIGMIGTGGSATGNTAFRNTFVVGTQNSKDLVFATNDTQRVSIDGSTGNVTVSGSLTAQNVINIATEAIQTTSARQWATIKNTGTGTGDYSEMKISNDNNDYLIMGSIGSGYNDGAWSNSSYIYANRELRIKSLQGIRFFVGGFAINSDDDMILEQAGNLGIGITSGISSRLHVNAEMSLGPDANNRGIIGYGSNILSLGTRQSSTNYFSTVNITGGTVGIGTPSPSQPLQINPAGGGYNLFFGRGNSTPGSSDPWLGLFNAATVGAATYGWGFYDSNSDGSFQIWNRNNSTSGAVALTIKRGGNVGIGTATPSSKLHVHSAADTQIRISADNSMALHQDAAWNSNMYFGAYHDGSNVVYGQTGRGAFRMVNLHDGDTSPQYIAFYGANAGTAGNTVSWNDVGLAMDEDGNVGINTTAPSTALHIDQPSNDRAGGLYIERNGSNYGLAAYVDSAGFAIIGGGGVFANDVIKMDINTMAVGLGGLNPTYRLDMQGAIGDGTPLIRGTATGTPAAGFNWVTEFMSANLAAGRRVVHVFGRARAVGASGHISYYESGVNDNNNQVQIGMYGANDILNCTYDRRVGINTNQPVSDLFVANRSAGGWRTTHGGTNLYVKSSGATFDPQVVNFDPTGIVVSVDSGNTTGPDKSGLVLYNDNTTAAGFSPMILFAKAESGSSPFKATMAAIYARSPAGSGNSDAWIDGELIFATSGAASTGTTAQMVLDKEGRLFLGKANFTNRGTAYAGRYWDTDGTDYYTKSSGNGYHFYDTSAYKFYVNANGGIYNYSGNNVNLSDERVKKNIEPLESQWAKVKLWNLKKFHLKTDNDSDSKRYGVIAQDVEIHNPEAVDEFMHTDDETRKAVKEQQLTWLAIKALQEAMERIETLEAEVAALKA